MTHRGIDADIILHSGFFDRIHGSLLRQNGSNEPPFQTRLQPLHRTVPRNLLVARRTQTLGRDWKFRNVQTWDVGTYGITGRCESTRMGTFVGETYYDSVSFSLVFFFLPITPAADEKRVDGVVLDMVFRIFEICWVTKFRWRWLRNQRPFVSRRRTAVGRLTRRNSQGL